MKNSNFTFTMKGEKKSYTLCLPRHYEKLLNSAKVNTFGDNGTQALRLFCEEYENLGKVKQAKIQKIIDSGLINFKLRTIYDLYVLTCTIDGFHILKGVSTPKQLADYFYGNDCDGGQRDGSMLQNRLGGAFYKGDYYYYLQN